MSDRVSPNQLLMKQLRTYFPGLQFRYKQTRGLTIVYFSEFATDIQEYQILNLVRINFRSRLGKFRLERYGFGLIPAGDHAMMPMHGEGGTSAALA